VRKQQESLYSQSKSRCLHHRRGAQPGAGLYNEVIKLELARHLGNNRVSMRIPVCDDLTLLNCSIIRNRNRCAVRYFVTLPFAALLVGNGDLTRARHRNEVALVMRHSLDVNQLRVTVRLDLNVIDRRGT
jgi:hypothetical protein